jgi:hypothetical protein
MQEYSTRLGCHWKMTATSSGISAVELRYARSDRVGGYPYVADGAKLSPFPGC